MLERCLLQTASHTCRSPNLLLLYANDPSSSYHHRWDVLPISVSVPWSCNWDQMELSGATSKHSLVYMWRRRGKSGEDGNCEDQLSRNRDQVDNHTSCQRMSRTTWWRTFTKTGIIHPRSFLPRSIESAVEWLNDAAVVVSGVDDVPTVLGVALLGWLLHLMHDPGFFDRQRARLACHSLLHGILSLLVVAQLDWTSVRTVLLQVVPVWFDNICASNLTVHGWSVNQGLDLSPSAYFVSSSYFRSLPLLQMTFDIRFPFIHDVLKLFLKGVYLLNIFDHLRNTQNLITSFNINDSWLTWFLEIKLTKTLNAHFSATPSNVSDHQIGNRIWWPILTDLKEPKHRLPATHGT